MKKFFNDFKAFISRGNVLDMAVGVIVGGAFQKIVSSLVNDVIMPLISGLVGIDIKDWVWQLHAPTCESSIPCTSASPDIIKAAVVLRYGNFIQAIIDFLLIAFTLFTVIKVTTLMGKKRRKLIERLEDEKAAKKAAEDSLAKEPVPEPEPVKDPHIELLSEIRDLLKKD